MRDNNALPLIRMDVEGLRYSVATMLTEHSARMDEDIKNALDKYCTPENLKRVIEEATFSNINHAIQEEIKQFFQYGVGRDAIKKAVSQSIQQVLSGVE